VREIQASASEKHTLACETLKPPKRRPEKTTKKTLSTAIRRRKIEREGGEGKNGEAVLSSSVFFP
jgi:hypothetical protein